MVSCYSYIYSEFFYLIMLLGAFLLGVLNPKVATAQTDGCPESCFCMEYMTCGSSDEKLYNGCNCCFNPGCTLHLCSNTTISCPTNWRGAWSILFHVLNFKICLQNNELYFATDLIIIINKNQSPWASQLNGIAFLSPMIRT